LDFETLAQLAGKRLSSDGRYCGKEGRMKDWHFILLLIFSCIVGILVGYLLGAFSWNLGISLAQ
jgi:hypothetical protein